MYLIFKTTVAICLIIVGTFLMSCRDNKSKSSVEKDNHNALSEDIYACPMHPEITGKQGDKCSKCGMELKSVKLQPMSKFKMQLSTLPQTVEAGKQTNIILAIKENDKIVSMDVSHEKKIHLIIVNNDLTWFHHIHPKEQTDGTYSITEAFPKGGNYLLFADYKPRSGEQTVSKTTVEVQGNPSDKSDLVTNKWVSNTDGYTVRLVNGNDLKTNRPQGLEISIEKDGKQLSAKELEQYLGAVAHIIMIDKADKGMLHVHPGSTKVFPIHGETFMKNTGLYRIWVQFKASGQVHTADFTVDVSHGESKEQKSHTHQH